MNRKETTKLLTEILIQDRMADRKYYAKVVAWMPLPTRYESEVE